MKRIVVDNKLRLKDLKSVIKTDLCLFDMTGLIFYSDIDTDGDVFKQFENYEVSSIRSHESCSYVDKGIVISIHK